MSQSSQEGTLLANRATNSSAAASEPSHAAHGTQRPSR
jgi:hypothetical protein